MHLVRYVYLMYVVTTVVNFYCYMLKNLFP